MYAASVYVRRDRGPETEAVVVPRGLGQDAHRRKVYDPSVEAAHLLEQIPRCRTCAYVSDSCRCSKDLPMRSSESQSDLLEDGGGSIHAFLPEPERYQTMS